MAITSIRNTEQVLKDIQELTKDIETLRIHYEQYFLGIIREEPTRLRDHVKGMIQRNAGVPVQNAAMKFQLQQCVARYSTFSAHWDRVLQQIEDGTYKRDVFKGKLHEQDLKKKIQAKKTKIEQITTSHSENFENLFKEYKDLKQSLNQNVNRVSFKSFEKQLIKKLDALKSSKEGKNFSFKIQKENNEVKIKLVAKKKDAKQK